MIKELLLFGDFVILAGNAWLLLLEKSELGDLAKCMRKLRDEHPRLKPDELREAAERVLARRRLRGVAAVFVGLACHAAGLAL